jgi:hypothetical protein
MINRLQTWFYELHIGGKIAIIFFGATAIDSASFVAGSRNIFPQFFYQFFGRVLYYGFVVGSFAGAIYFGMKTSKKYSKSWLGWVVGISVFACIMLIMDLAKEIPGIGSVMKGMQNSDCYIDWDGRANPTVCD